MTLVGRWWSAIKSAPSRIATWFVSPEFDEDVEAIRKTTVRLCGFLPTAATVSNILAAGNPSVLAVTSVAGAICMAVTRKAQMHTLYGLEEVPTVEGVVIEGEWVK